MFYRFVDNRFFPGCIDAFLVLSTRNDPGEGGTEKNDIKYDGVCMWNLSLFIIRFRLLHPLMNLFPEG